MGNKTIKDVLDYDRDKEYTFFGRQNEINEIKELLDMNDIVQMYGMSKIGKSRLLIRLLEGFWQQRTCFYHDCREDNLEHHDVLIKLLNEFIDEIKEIAGAKSEESVTPNDVVSAVNQFKETLKSCGASFTKPVLFLDNLETSFMDKSIKDDILKILREISSLRGSAVKVIFTTSEKIIIPIKTFGETEILPLNDDHIGEILREIIEAKGTTMDEDFDFGEGILSDKNKVFMNIIVRQCEGLPFIAIMVAMELTADEGMFTPADLVQLLFTQRVKSLSLEYYPPQDRIDLLKRDIEKVQDLDKYFLKTLNKHLDENNRNSIESLRSEITKHDEKTIVDIKKCFRLLTHPCIIRYLGKSHEIDMHAIFRQCICDMTGTDSIDDETFRKLLMDSAKRYGLDLTDKHIDSPKLLEEYINKLGETENSNENLQGLESGRQTNAPDNIVEKFDESKEGENVNTSSAMTGLIAQPSDDNDEIKMCEQCNKVKRFANKDSNDPGQSGMPIKPGNVDLNNVDLCSCRPKMNDLKTIHSIEDNTAVPTVYVRDNLFMKASSFMRTSLDHSDKPLNSPDDVDLENSAPSSPQDQVTLPKTFNVTPDLSACDRVISSEITIEEENDVQFNRLSITSLLNYQFPRNRLLLHKQGDKQCNMDVSSSNGHNKSVDDNDLEITPDLKNNTLNFDTLLTVSDTTKQALSCTQMTPPKSTDSFYKHINSETSPEMNVGDPDFDTLLDSTGAAKLHRLKSIDVGSNSCRAEATSSNSTNQLAMSYTVNLPNCHGPKDTCRTKNSTISNYKTETKECEPNTSSSCLKKHFVKYCKECFIDNGDQQVPNSCPKCFHSKLESKDSS